MENSIMITLAVIWAGFLFGGFAFGKMNAEQTHRIARPLRMFSSLTLVIAGWAWHFNAPATQGDFPLWIALGMTFGFLGDLFMARLIVKRDEHVLFGMGAFGVGHVFYIIGLLKFAPIDSTFWLSWAFWAGLGVVSWFFLIWRTAQQRELVHLIALPYAVLLASTAGFATGLALHTGGYVVMAIGAALFLLSDFILALQLFNGLKFKGIGDIVWLTYGPGQMLIVFCLWTLTL
jgi:uncharacterized membrane protein YhhN